MKQKIQTWQTYWGKLATSDDVKKTSLFGFENFSKEYSHLDSYKFLEKGTLFGFVSKGTIKFSSLGVDWTICSNQWFSIALHEELEINFSAKSKLFVSLTHDYFGLPAMGGPVEDIGRLSYIDGCTDTLLMSPPLLGDPCLNLLHFPRNITQTMHYHPSCRTGIVNKGSGICDIEDGQIQLAEDDIFIIPKNFKHNFKTTNKEILNVISYHPDSDWGPTNEVHPMINRTWT